MLDQFGVSVVLCVALVVKLNHVEIDQVSDSFVDSHVPSVGIVLALEVGSLGTVRDNVVGNGLPQSYREVDQPLLTLACLHGIVVLPVDVSSIEVIFKDEPTKSCSARFRVLVVGGRKFGGSKGTDEDFYSSIVVGFSDSSLDFLILGSPRIFFSQVH